MSLKDPLIIARISGVYGIKGWLKVHSFTEPAENVLAYKDTFYAAPAATVARADSEAHASLTWKEFEFDQGKRHGKGLIAHVAGIDTREQAEALKGYEIAVERAALPELEADEFYWHELEGLAVMIGGLCLGRVDHLIETGANDVLVVKPADLASEALERRERLIPWIKGDVIKEVDLEGGLIKVDWDPEF